MGVTSDVNVRGGIDVHTGTHAGDVRISQAEDSSADRLLGLSSTAPVGEGVHHKVEWFRASFEEGVL